MKKFLIVLGLLSIILPNVALTADPEQPCHDKSGLCMTDDGTDKCTKVAVSPFDKGGHYETGLCTGGAIYKCCVPNSNSSSNTNTSGGVLGGNISGGCMKSGDCTVNDFLELGINITKWILGIVGSLVIAMFVYGGFKMVISRGESKEVQSGKDIIKAAVIGTVIIFSSYVVIKFFMGTMGIDWQGTTGPVKLLPVSSNIDSSCSAQIADATTLKNTACSADVNSSLCISATTVLNNLSATCK